MIYKCNNCTKQICEPPCQDDPYGEFFCSAGHWDSCDCFYSGHNDEPIKDPWEFCKDYVPNI